MANVNRKMLKVSEIDNFVNNPRTETAINSFEEIKKLYGDNSTSRRNLINLAKNIAEKGYDSTEAIVVVAESGKYTAYDGNRRIASLKLLLDYEKFDFLTLSDKTMLEKLSKAGVIPDSIETVVKGKEDALDYMQRVHGGQQDGVGHSDWSAENKRRFSERRGGYILTNELNKGFEKEFGTKIVDELPVTTIDRILGNKEVKEELGINKEQKNFSREQLEKVRETLQKAKSISENEGQAVTRTFATSKDISKKLLPEISQPKIWNEQLQAKKGQNNKLSPSIKATKIKKKELFKLTSSLPSNSPNQNVILVRKLMTVLNQLWKNDKDKYDIVVAPSLRSIFEIAFNELRDREILGLKKGNKIDANNSLEIVLAEISKSKKLSQISSQINQSYNSLQNQFSKNADEIMGKYILSHDGAHRATTMLSDSDIENIANKAELFAVVSFHFVLLEDSNGK